MGGFFGVAGRGPCVMDLFYGTDYHSHLGTRRGGLATLDRGRFHRFIHSIENAQFRSKFEEDLKDLPGTRGIGVISDNEDQPVIVHSHLGTYAIVTVGKVANAAALTERVFAAGRTHFAEMGGGGVNPTELVAALINRGGSFVEGIALAQEEVEGSCSLLLLTEEGIYAARDAAGRTPVAVGRSPQGFAVALETCAFPNLGFEVERHLGPGEVVLLTEDGVAVKKPAADRMRVCAFLWVYYGFPASSYEGINVEACRYRCGAALARRDVVTPDCVAGIPDSGVGHAIGYATEARIPYCRPFVKYTPTWPRSFMPQDQGQRDLVARMKLIPIRELVEGRRLLFCEDSIVRGTQLSDTIRRLFDAGAAEVHMRPACPPLLYGCRFLNFSQSKSEMDLAARRAVKLLDGDRPADLASYADPSSDRHRAMVEKIAEMLGLTSLRYQRLGDLVEAIGLPKDRLCTWCWDAQG